jgi:triosephosphate isomerase
MLRCKGWKLKKSKVFYTPPFFEVGPKAYSYGKDILELAKFGDGLSQKYQVQMIFTPQTVDIPALASVAENILVFAQHMDSIRIGRGVGSVLPEAIKAAGADGVLLNHVEKPLALDEIERAIQRAREVGLATLVCAATLADVAAVARLGPNLILAESPEMIEGGKRNENDQSAISMVNEIVRKINPQIHVLQAAGINSEQDVYDVMIKGAQGTGSTSAIFKSRDPFQALEKMIRAVREAWDQIHPQ